MSVNQQSQFFVSQNEKEIGPLTRDEIASRLKSGEFSIVDFVYVEEKSDWITLLEFFPDVDPQPVTEKEVSPQEKLEAAPEVTSDVTSDITSDVTPPALDESTHTGAVLLLDEMPIEELNQNTPPPIIPESDQPSAPSDVIIMSGTVASGEQAQEGLAREQEQVQTLDENTLVEAVPEDSVIKAILKEVESQSVIENKPASPKAPLHNEPLRNEPKEANDGATRAAKSSASQPSSNLLVMKGGIGDLELVHFQAGQVSLCLDGSVSQDLQVELVSPIRVKAAQAEKITLKRSSDAIEVGQNIQIELEALDRFGNIDTSFSKEFSLEVGGACEGGGRIHFESGRAKAILTNRKAESVQVALIDTSKTGVDVSEAHVLLQFKAGPAVRLTFIAPEEVTAGEPIKVQVKAVDAYGNLAADYSGDLKVEATSDDSRSA